MLGNKTNPNRIIVLGGSFTPPTLAHFMPMQAAPDMVCAQLGIFVTVSHAYPKRKMRGGEKRKVCLSETIRLKMPEPCAKPISGWQPAIWNTVAPSV